MPLFSRLKQSFFPHSKKETEPAEAYDQWSSAYDSQPDNLMLAMDEQVTTSLLEGIAVTIENYSRYWLWHRKTLGEIEKRRPKADSWL